MSPPEPCIKYTSAAPTSDTCPDYFTPLYVNTQQQYLSSTNQKAPNYTVFPSMLLPLLDPPISLSTLCSNTFRFIKTTLHQSTPMITNYRLFKPRCICCNSYCQHRKQANDTRNLSFPSSIQYHPPPSRPTAVENKLFRGVDIHNFYGCQLQAIGPLC
jgi:hypothetical protein